MYRQVTVRVGDDVQRNRFDDAARMEALDVVFAQRFLDAFHAWRSQQPHTASWKIAFDCSGRWSPVVLQHLLLGMHAHIMLDLGIAAATVSPGESIHALERDFHGINTLLADMVDDIQDALSEVSPWGAAILDFAGGRSDEFLINFGVKTVRASAWRWATELAVTPHEEWPALIESRDRDVHFLARVIQRPGPLLRCALVLARLGEPRDVRRVIEMLE